MNIYWFFFNFWLKSTLIGDLTSFISFSERTYGCDWGPHATVHQRTGLSGACTEYGQTFFGPRFDLGGPHWPRLGPPPVDEKVLRISETSYRRWTQKQRWWGKIFLEEILYLGEFLPLWLLIWLLLSLFGPVAIDKKMLRISETSYRRWTQKQWGKCFFLSLLIFDHVRKWDFSW